jgi:hypothetical protein
MSPATAASFLAGNPDKGGYSTARNMLLKDELSIDTYTLIVIWTPQLSLDISWTMSAQVVYGCYRNPNASTPVGPISSRITESAIAAMVKHSFSSLAVCAVLLTSALAQSGIRYGAMGSKRQNQIVFPPANGPCPQNHGQTPCKSMGVVFVPAHEETRC